jgi:hypothetical protein
MKKLFFLCIASIAVVPIVVFAETITDFKSLMQLFANVLGMAMGFLYTVAFAAFFWGIALFILNTNDDKKRQEGKAWMFWSVIALFVMITLWGIISLFVNTVGVGRVVIPQL